jgi:hypothetical protein
MSYDNDSDASGEQPFEGMSNETPAAEDAVAEHQPAEEVAAADQPAEEAVAEETVAADQAAEETVAEDQPAEDQAADETAAEDQPAEDQAADETAAEDQPAEDQAAEETAAEDQPAEDQAAEETAAEDQPVEDQAAEETAAEDQAEDQPADQTDNGEWGAVETTEDDQPAEETAEATDDEQAADEDQPDDDAQAAEAPNAEAPASDEEADGAGAEASGLEQMSAGAENEFVFWEWEVIPVVAASAFNPSYVDVTPAAKAKLYAKGRLSAAQERTIKSSENAIKSKIGLELKQKIKASTWVVDSVELGAAFKAEYKNGIKLAIQGKGKLKFKPGCLVDEATLEVTGVELSGGGGGFKATTPGSAKAYATKVFTTQQGLGELDDFAEKIGHAELALEVGIGFQVAPNWSRIAAELVKDGVLGVVGGEALITAGFVAGAAALVVGYVYSISEAAELARQHEKVKDACEAQLNAYMAGLLGVELPGWLSAGVKATYQAGGSQRVDLEAKLAEAREQQDPDAPRTCDEDLRKRLAEYLSSHREPLRAAARPKILGGVQQQVWRTYAENHKDSWSTDNELDRYTAFCAIYGCTKQDLQRNVGLQRIFHAHGETEHTKNKFGVPYPK